MTQFNARREVAIKRIHEASGSWMLLEKIQIQFGQSNDGAVERDMAAAEARLKTAIRQFSEE